MLNDIKLILNNQGGFWGAVAGAVGGGLISAFSQQKANQSNEKLSSRQMRFQRDMSNTAHQRQVKDLKAAGLNPILSANTGASAPQGSMAQMQPEDPNIGDVVSTALEAKRLKQDLKNLKATEKQTKQLTQESKAKTAAAVNTANKIATENKLLNSKVPGAQIKEDIMQGVQSQYKDVSRHLNKIFQTNKSSAKGNLK